MQTEWDETIVSLYALAGRLEEEGQLNVAKLARACVEALLRGAAYQRALPSDKAALIAELERLTPQLARLELDANVLEELKRGTQDMQQGKLTLYTGAPNPYVCRTCGYLSATLPATNCPTCNSHPDSFMQIMPHYWFDALEPFAALAAMQQTPKLVAELINGLSEEQFDKPPADGGWALRTVMAHLRDAQGVLAFRMNLILTQENPPLEALALFETAGQETGERETSRAMFETYLASRRETVERLKKIPLQDWWRTGQHREFGKITLKQQTSYFVAHEITHLPQIEMLRNQAR